MDQPLGIWSDGRTMWVNDFGGRVYAYVLTPGDTYGNRDSAKDFGLADDNDFPWDNLVGRNDHVGGRIQTKKTSSSLTR